MKAGYLHYYLTLLSTCIISTKQDDSLVIIQPPATPLENISTSPLIDILKVKATPEPPDTESYVIEGVVEFEPTATPDAWNRVLRKYEFFFVNFYADWCRFSKALEPNWRMAAKLVADNPKLSPKAAFARVECDSHSPLIDICRYYGINKYPTMTLFKHGIRGRGAEFRGSRAPEALAEFVEQQARLAVRPLPAFTTLPVSAKEIVPLLDLEAVKLAKEAVEPGVVIYGLFGGAGKPGDVADAEELVFKQVSGHFLDGPCRFFAHKVSNDGDNSQVASITSYFLKEDKEDKYEGPIQDFISLLDWVKEQCVPLVRELKFDNAEALTEEGLPFLVLFRDPEDETSLEDFVRVINEELIAEKDMVNFLHADGLVFNHPLQHLGKTSKDLPLVALDNFVHVFGLPEGVDFRVPGVMTQFIQDLYSGKLHLDLHHQQEYQRISGLQILESVFKKLVPSRKRYSLLYKDEL